eukprot:tig00020918_g15884.t1
MIRCTHVEKEVSYDLLRKRLESGPWKCDDCGTEDSVWACLACGHLGCGRYLNSHAWSHKHQAGHASSLDFTTKLVHCSACEEYVVGDSLSHEIQLLREIVCDFRPCTKQQAKAGKRSRISPQFPLIKFAKLDCQNEQKDANHERTLALSPGLKNLGNTCFLNAVIQNLSHMRELRQYFLQHELPGPCPPSTNSHFSDVQGTWHNDVSLCSELKALFKDMTEGSMPCEPGALLEAVWKAVPRFRGHQQQDAHEFLRYLLDRMHLELTGRVDVSQELNFQQHHVFDGDMSAILHTFQGRLLSSITCDYCGCTSTKEDVFLDLSLDIPEKFIPPRRQTATVAVPRPPCMLADCLKAFTDPERLKEGEKYQCDKCDTKVDAVKRLVIDKLPLILCLHIKRFRWHSYNRSKIDVHVDFPLSHLNLRPFCTASCMHTLYDLIGVVNHHGLGSGSGHYTSFVLDESGSPL